MRRSLLIAMVAAAAAACSRTPLDGQALAGRMAQLAERGDTVALARLADEACRGLRQDDRRTCLEDYFLTLSDGGRVRLALGALSALASRQRQVEADGHSYTHVIGIRAWDPDQDIADVFASCTGLFQSGCYHGVIQAYLTATGELDSTRVVELCDRIGAQDDSPWLRFQCVHGLGHGLEMIHNWDLPRALAGCDWLTTSWDRESCYGGAFMENAVASQPGGHHTSARALAADGTADTLQDHAAHGGGHGHHGAPDPATITFRMRDSTDLLYPCTAVEERYQRACYMLQGGMILQALNMDFARAAAECDRVEAVNLRTLCYLSLGTYSSGLTVQNTRRSIGHCLQGDPGYQPWCFVGVVKNYIDVTARPADGIAFCREVPPGRNRNQCYVAVGEQIQILFYGDRDRAERECSAAPADGADPCRWGAGLLLNPPPGLPVLPGGAE
jgi:hypothetical protein